MTRFAGVFGYGEKQEFPEPGSGDFKFVITERKYFGVVVRNSRRVQEEGKINSDLVLQNSFNVLADPYARDNMEKLCYVKWRGNYWVPEEVTEIYPRLLVRLGKLYNGPKAVPDGP